MPGRGPKRGRGDRSISRAADMTAFCSRHGDGTVSWYLALHHTITDATSSSLVFEATAAAYRESRVRRADLLRMGVGIWGTWRARLRTGRAALAGSGSCAGRRPAVPAGPHGRAPGPSGADSLLRVELFPMSTIDSNPTSGC